MTLLQDRKAALGILCGVAFLGWSIWFANHPVRWLLSYVRDDAFYYFQIAWNLAHTGKSTFDGVDLTNGYHPGWMLLLTLAAKALPTKPALLRAAVLMVLGLHAAGAWLFGRYVVALTGRGTELLPALFWLTCPAVAIVNLYSCETALLAVAVLGTLIFVRTRIEPALNDRLPTGALVKLGALLGLACYARTDQILFAGIVALAIALYGSRSVGWGERIRRAAVPIAVAGATLLPWMIYSVSLVGSLAQDSAVSKMVRSGSEMFTVSHALLFLEFWIIRPACQFAHARLMPSLALGISVLVILAIGIAATRTYRLFGPSIVCLFVATLLYGIAYSFEYEYQFWYFLTPMLSLAVLAWLAISSIPKASSAVAAAVILLPIVFYFAAPPRQETIEQELFDTQKTFDRLTPPSVVYGCLNSGIAGYFSNHRVVDLDGLVDHGATMAWQNGSLQTFTLQSGVTYIADNVKQLTESPLVTGDQILLHPVASLPAARWSPPIRVVCRVVIRKH